MGEEDFVFPTYGGAVRLSATDDALTPFGGLVPWAAFVRRCGLFERLSASCPAVRTNPKGNAAWVCCGGIDLAHRTTDGLKVCSEEEAIKSMFVAQRDQPKIESTRFCSRRRRGEDLRLSDSGGSQPSDGTIENHSCASSSVTSSR